MCLFSAVPVLGGYQAVQQHDVQVQPAHVVVPPGETSTQFSAELVRSSTKIDFTSMVRECFSLSFFM
jgi:hypothetical protein